MKTREEFVDAIMKKVESANPELKIRFRGLLIYNDMESLGKILENVKITEGNIDCRKCSLMHPEYDKHGGIAELKAVWCDRFEESDEEGGVAC